MKKLDKNYVSNIDLALKEFDQQHSPSESQTAEIMKYKHLHQKRDNAILTSKSKKDHSSFWEW